MLDEGFAARALPWIIGLGALLRMQGLGWDGYAGLHPDEGNLIRGAMSLAWPDRLIPDFHAYNGLSLWLPKLVAWPFCGADAGAGCLTWAARLVSALCGAAAVAIGAMLARLLAGPVVALFAAVLLALSEPLLQWAHFGTTESALLLAVLGLWYLAARHLGGALAAGPFGLASGVLIGLALGMKTTGAILGSIPLAALLLAPRPFALRNLLPAAGGIGLALTIFLLSTPAILWDWPAYSSVMRFEADVVSGAAEVFWTRQFVGATDVLYEIGQLWRMTEGVGLLLAVAGLWIALRGSAWRAWLPGLVLALVYLALIVTWQAKFTRYLAPILPVVLLLAALALDRLSSAGSSSLRVVAVGAVALIAANGVSLALSYRAVDPRQALATDIDARALPGDLVLVEPFDVGAHLLPPDLETEILPLDSGVEAPALAAALDQAHWLVIFSRRNWSVLPGLQGEAALCRYYAALASGALGFEVVAHFERPTPLGGLLAPGLAAEETRVVFDRPDVFLFERIEMLPRQELETRLAEPVPAAACSPDAIASGLERVR